MPKFKVSNRAMLKAINAQRGLISKIAEQVNMDYEACRLRIHRDPELEAELERQRDKMTDHVESKFGDAIDKGEAWAIALYLRTIGRSRGYVERIEIDDRRDAENRAKQMAERRGLNPDRILAIAEDIIAGRS